MGGRADGERAASARTDLPRLLRTLTIHPHLSPLISRAAEALGLPPIAALNVSIDESDAVTEAGSIASLVEDMIIIQVGCAGDACCVGRVGDACGARKGAGRVGAEQRKDWSALFAALLRTARVRLVRSSIGCTLCATHCLAKLHPTAALSFLRRPLSTRAPSQKALSSSCKTARTGLTPRLA